MVLFDLYFMQIYVMMSGESLQLELYLKSRVCGHHVDHKKIPDFFIFDEKGRLLSRKYGSEKRVIT